MIWTLLMVISLHTQGTRPASIPQTLSDKCVCPNYRPELKHTYSFCGYEIMSNKSSSQPDLDCVPNVVYGCKEGPNKPGKAKPCYGDSTCMKGSEALVKVRGNEPSFNDPRLRYCVGKENIAKMKALEGSSSSV